MKINDLLLSLLMISFPAAAHALAIDNMVLISGKDADANRFTLTGNTSAPVFVRTEVARVYVKNGEVIEEPFNRDNLMSWTVTVDPAMFILDPGESRKVTMRPLTQLSTRTEDEVYSVGFIPQARNEAGEANQMSMQIGFRTWYIVPAAESRMDYALRYRPTTGKLTLENRGNTVMLVDLDRCSKDVELNPEKSCKVSFMAIPGRTKEYEVPEWLRGADMHVEVTNHDRSWRRTETPEVLK